MLIDPCMNITCMGTPICIWLLSRGGINGTTWCCLGRFFAAAAGVSEIAFELGAAAANGFSGTEGKFFLTGEVPAQSFDGMEVEPADVHDSADPNLGPDAETIENFFPVVLISVLFISLQSQLGHLWSCGCVCAQTTFYRRVCARSYSLVRYLSDSLAISSTEYVIGIRNLLYV